jgi:GNAT superfamily N-acetyltransferase
MPGETTGVNAAMPSVDVAMVRTTMENLPAWPLPAGFRLRNYRDGDRETWIDVHADEPLFAVTGDHFDETFGTQPQARYDRLFFVETGNGEAAGTVAAWWNDDWEGSGAWGQIHWVAVRKAFRGRGLARPMTAHALRRIAQEYSRTMLDTNTVRVPAIKIYLDCGFLPAARDLGDSTAAAAWQAVQAQLNHPLLAHALAAPQ